MIDPAQPRPLREHLAAVSTPDLIARFAKGIEGFDARVTKMSDADLDTAFLADAGVGVWPCRLLIGHLADAELSFVHRMRRVVAEDGPVFDVWDENAFIDRGLYGTPANGARFPVGAFLATIHTLRRWTAEWLATLPAEDFGRAGLHPERGRLTLRTIIEYDTWHLEHHGWYLNAKVRKLKGPGAA